MKVLRIILFIYTLIVTCSFIIYSFYNVDVNVTIRTKPVHFKVKNSISYFFKFTINFTRNFKLMNFRQKSIRFIMTRTCIRNGLGHLLFQKTIMNRTHLNGMHQSAYKTKVFMDLAKEELHLFHLTIINN